MFSETLPLFVFLRFLFLYVRMFCLLHTCAGHVFLLSVEFRESELQELELWEVMSHCVGVRNQIWVPFQNSQYT